MKNCRKKEEELEKVVTKKYSKRDKKKKRTMKISGAKVRNLQKIISARGGQSK